MPTAIMPPQPTSRPTHGPEILLATGTALAAALPLLWLGPSELGLALASLLLLVVGFALAFAFRSAARAAAFSYRDAGGVLVLLGFALAMVAAD